MYVRLRLRLQQRLLLLLLIQVTQVGAYLLYDLSLGFDSALPYAIYYFVGNVYVSGRELTKVKALFSSLFSSFFVFCLIFGTQVPAIQIKFRLSVETLIQQWTVTMGQGPFSFKSQIIHEILLTSYICPTSHSQISILIPSRQPYYLSRLTLDRI